MARAGLQSESSGDARARAAITRRNARSNESAKGGAGLALEEVQQTLRLYVEGLTGHAVEIAPLAAVPDEARIGDGRTIHLPSTVAEFGDDEKDFRLYKVLAAHAAGQIEFGTYERDVVDLQAAYTSIAELYAPENVDARDAFALDGYINEMAKTNGLLPEEEAQRAARERKRLPPESDYRAVLLLFPNAAPPSHLRHAGEWWIDRRLRHIYRRPRARYRPHARPLAPGASAIQQPAHHARALRAAFQITLCGGALDDTRAFTARSFRSGKHRGRLSFSPDASVADTLMATAASIRSFINHTGRAVRAVGSLRGRGDASEKKKATAEQMQRPRVYGSAGLSSVMAREFLTRGPTRSRRVTRTMWTGRDVDAAGYA